jgi:hypothetical protein
MLMRASDEDGQERIEEALRPPNKINPATGVPFGWDEDDELAGLEAMLDG